MCWSDVHLSASCIDGHRASEHCFARGVRASRSNMSDCVECQVFGFCNKSNLFVGGRTVRGKGTFGGKTWRSQQRYDQ